MQLSSSGNEFRWVCLSSSEHSRPYKMPSTMLMANTTAKSPHPYTSDDSDRCEPRSSLSVSNMTIDTASFRMLSPKMMLYSWGSTLYVVKMARIVTGSVALNVLPKIRHSSRERRGASKRITEAIHTMRLRQSGHVPNDHRADERAKKCECEDGAKVPEELGLAQLVPAGQNDRRKKHIQHNGIAKRQHLAHRLERADAQHETDEHACVSVRTNLQTSPQSSHEPR